MTLKEYLHCVWGYQESTKIRRSELKAAVYPIYRNTLAALGGKNKPVSYDDYIPTGPPEKKEPLTDPDGLLKKAMQRLNPHLKLKYD